MKNVLFTLSAAALALGLAATSASAQQATANAGVNGTVNGQVNGGDTNNDGRSVGLAGLPGGECSEGFTIGAVGAGIGASKLNRACLAANIATNAGARGVIHPKVAEAVTLQALDSLGYGVRMQPAATQSSRSPAPQPNSLEAVTIRLQDGSTRKLKSDRVLTAWYGCDHITISGVNYRKPGC